MFMTFDETIMHRCLELAKMALGQTIPNPMVGSVLVFENKIIGEGYHQRAGEAHAEVNAINSVENKSLIPLSTLYVSLEPCSHYGKTPPCCERIVQEGIKKVIVGTLDTTTKVNGKGISYLQQNNVEVLTPMLNDACRFSNRRFFTYHEKHRPYIILKWAESADGFIAPENAQQQYSISNTFSKTLSHKWRTEEQAILVGTKTAIIDNPQLNSRLWEGNAPIRVVIDKNLAIPTSHHLFDGSVKTILINQKKEISENNIDYIKINFQENPATQILNVLYQLNIQSVIIEGGTKTLQLFIQNNLWDEGRVFTGKKQLIRGIKAPEFSISPSEITTIADDTLKIIYNV
jgi:diaminohydroxyphosphoribosylaminopyrimidine deaminase/5-amino-6-(5-phosphoribosylamino)uracil reductase